MSQVDVVVVIVCPRLVLGCKICALLARGKSQQEEHRNSTILPVFIIDSFALSRVQLTAMAASRISNFIYSILLLLPAPHPNGSLLLFSYANYMSVVREMGNDDRAMMMLMMIITMDWCLLFVEIFALFFGSLDIELQSMRNLFYF